MFDWHSTNSYSYRHCFFASILANFKGCDTFRGNSIIREDPSIFSGYCY